MYHTTLDQWLIFQTVIDSGGYTAAANQLFRSQSSVSNAVSKLQERLGVQLVFVVGKKVKLTIIGAALLEDVRPLLKAFVKLESKAQVLHAGAPAKIRLKVDSVYPKKQLFSVLAQFKTHYPHTLIELKEVIRLTANNTYADCDLAIGMPVKVQQPVGEKLLDVELIAVAHPNHPLHSLKKRELSQDDLAHYVQVYLDNGDVEHAEMADMPRQRWTVNTVDAAIAAVCSELCFGWLPRHMVSQLIDNDTLRVLPLNVGLIRKIPLYLLYSHPDQDTQATHQLVALLKASGSPLPEV